MQASKRLAVGKQNFAASAESHSSEPNAIRFVRNGHSCGTVRFRVAAGWNWLDSIHYRALRKVAPSSLAIWNYRFMAGAARTNVALRATWRFVRRDAWVEMRVVRLAAQQLKIAGRVRGNLPISLQSELGKFSFPIARRYGVKFPS
jgi:hypothetical protein